MDLFGDGQAAECFSRIAGSSLLIDSSGPPRESNSADKLVEECAEMKNSWAEQTRPRGRRRRVSPWRRILSRSGVAATELAICLPLITLVVFGGIETADMIFLKQNLKNVGYEGGRSATKFNSDNAEVLSRMNALLEVIPVNDATITLELPAGKSDVRQLSCGEIIKIIVSAPAESNTVGPLRMYGGQTITANTLVVRE
jgi:hypothetical protein